MYNINITKNDLKFIFSGLENCVDDSSKEAGIYQLIRMMIIIITIISKAQIKF